MAIHSWDFYPFPIPLILEPTFAIIGDVGAGKSTALRYALSQLPDKQFAVLPVIGGNWSFVELLRQCMAGLGVFTRTTQQSTMLRSIHESFGAIRENGRIPVVCIDEASLFQQNAYNQLHLLSQQSLTDGYVVPVVMCGQESLFEHLRNPFCRPLMNRILDGFNLRGMSQDETSRYIVHHVSTISGGSGDLFDEKAMIAVHQGAAGIPRRINELCLLAMNDAMLRQQRTVSMENVRTASRAWWEN